MDPADVFCSHDFGDWLSSDLTVIIGGGGVDEFGDTGLFAASETDVGGDDRLIGDV